MMRAEDPLPASLTSVTKPPRPNDQEIVPVSSLGGDEVCRISTLNVDTRCSCNRLSSASCIMIIGFPSTLRLTCTSSRICLCNRPPIAIGL